MKTPLNHMLTFILIVGVLMGTYSSLPISTSCAQEGYEISTGELFQLARDVEKDLKSLGSTMKEEVEHKKTEPKFEEKPGTGDATGEEDERERRSAFVRDLSVYKQKELELEKKSYDLLTRVVPKLKEMERKEGMLLSQGLSPVEAQESYQNFLQGTASVLQEYPGLQDTLLPFFVGLDNRVSEINYLSEENVLNGLSRALERDFILSMQRVDEIQKDLIFLSSAVMREWMLNFRQELEALREQYNLPQDKVSSNNMRKRLLRFQRTDRTFDKSVGVKSNDVLRKYLD